MTDWPLDWRDLVDEAVRRRKNEGRTQKSFAALAGVSVPTVIAFERGDTRLRLDSVFKILESLGMVALPSAPDSLPAFIHAARRRWEELVAPLPADHPSRQSLGHADHAYRIEGVEAELSLGALRTLLGTLPKTSGWTPFWVPTREALRPIIRDSVLECWLGEPGAERVFSDAAHSDFWHFSADLDAYLQRGYQEDGASLEPGALFDLTLPIWRTAEVLLHAAHLVQRLDGDPGATIRYVGRYTGLEGRELIAWAAPRLRLALDEHCRSRSGRADLGVETSPRELIQDLDRVVHRCLVPLYERFDGFDLTLPFVQTQIAEFRRAGLNL